MGRSNQSFATIARGHALLTKQEAREIGTQVSSRYSVPLQVTQVDQMKRPVASTASTKPTPLRILVVDDEPLFRIRVARLLSRDGHSVDTATDGRSGLETFRGNGYDVVITDRIMPVMGGDELAAGVKRIEPNVPVIMLTALGNAMLATGERPPGVDVVIDKLFTDSELRQALAHAGCL